LKPEIEELYICQIVSRYVNMQYLKSFVWSQKIIGVKNDIFMLYFF
jgi:hypothetical protein